MSPPRPSPKLTDLNRAFWTGGAEGKLNFLHCADCDNFTHPPLQLCRHCQSENVAWRAVPGTGTIDCFTVNHQAWVPGLDLPYVIARIAIDGAPGVYLTSNIIETPIEDLGPDDPVAVTFEQQGEIFFPLFKKVG